MKRRKISEKQKYANQFATVTKDLATVEPRCRHYGDCGGCTLQHLSDADQIAVKRQVFWRLIGKHGVRWALRGQLPQVEISPSATGYRQRMDFAFAHGKAGLRGSSWKDVVELEECHLVGEPGWCAFARCRALSRELGIPDHVPGSGEGQLRYAVIRCNRAGEVLLGLVCFSRAHDELIERLALGLIDEGVVVGVHQLLNDTKGDVSTGPSLRCWGRPVIEERLGELRFELGPNTFFQANPAIAERAYQHIRDWLAPLAPELGLDLYSGTGTIAAVLAQACRRVIAVENNPHNEAAAATNFAANGITNVDYRLADVGEFLRGFDQPVDALVLNPPRSGVGEAALAPIIELAPKRIAYMSCNALSLLEDCRLLGKRYRCAGMWVLDMFPQTRHFEVLVCFERREPDDPPDPVFERGPEAIDFLRDRD